MPFKDPEKRKAWWAKNGPRYKADRHFRPSARGRFVGVDGEGWGKTYALLADSEGHNLVRPSGISSSEALEWLSFLPERCGKAVFLGYALNYDINHWLKDLPDNALYRLWKEGEVRWEDYWIQWAPTRWFHVKHLPSGRSVRVYDVFPFFQGSFLKACEEWEVAVPQEVKDGKAARQNFGPTDLPTIIAYNRVELTALVALVGKLKDGLYSAGINLSRWYGAGAIATHLLSAHGAKSDIAETPPEVQEAALVAYFGGRIEAGRTGQIAGPIYNFDLRSAYPDAMRTLPNLANGRWERIPPSEDPDWMWFWLGNRDRFAVYRIEWEFPQGWRYYPLPWREKDGSIYFPRVGRGWYWTPEVAAAVHAGKFRGGKVRVLGGWRFVPNDPNERAFPWVEDLYRERQRVGPKTGAGKAIKLGINALYGKMAQRSGVFSRVPTFRSYPYAGYITSYVRAALWRYTEAHLDSVISYATDGIYATSLLDKDNPSRSLLDPHGPPLGPHLGDWELSVFDGMDIVMAGVYRLRKKDGSWDLYGRGYGKGGVPWDRVIEGWSNGEARITVTVPRLHTLGECIHVRSGRVWVNRAKWRSWTQEEKEIRLKEPALKRVGAHPFDPQFGVPSDSAPYDSRRDRTEETIGQRTAPSPYQETRGRTLLRDGEPLPNEGGDLDRIPPQSRGLLAPA